MATIQLLVLTLASITTPHTMAFSMVGAATMRPAFHLASEASSTSEDGPLPVYDAKTDSALDRYKAEHRRSITDPTGFWAEKSTEFLDWEQEYHSVMSGSLESANVRWFEGGKLNVCYNAIDRHVLHGKGDSVAMIWEGDEPTDTKSFTFAELQAQVSRIAGALTAQGVRKGDIVTIYMPMIPELPMTMLACARIGAAHSVVFAGFSAEALAQRIVAAKSAVVVTAATGLRGGKTIPLKKIVDDARTKEGAEETLQSVLVWERIDEDQEIPDTPSCHMQEKDIRMESLVRKQRPYTPPVTMDAEDNLFILYTSGSTGAPKGLVHTTGGYALYAAFTTKTTFDLSESDVFACVADCGWITGHTYTVYGPLINGATTVIFESTPLYPDPGRYWDMIDRHQITQFYTAPTAIRSLMRFGDSFPLKYKLDSLKILGSVGKCDVLAWVLKPFLIFQSTGEPINPEAWRWYYENVGRKKCTIVDTYWQTETGGHSK